jgi:hypothetical protein
MTFLRRHLSLWSHALLALLAYPALLLTAPGRVGADTKTYLYLDPGRLLARAWSMWDPNIGLGTVSHQTIGYLFPMGPFYWLLDAIGLPDWVAQRLWLGTLLFAAGAGVLFLLRTLRWQLGPALVAALAYMLCPYWLDYAARISAILLPWAGLPWMIGLTIRSIRDGGWRWPALFAVVVALVGGVNATALVFAGLGPVLWVLYALFVERDVATRRVLAATARIGALTLLTSLWWIAGLAVQGSYGVDILRFTETIPTVARTSLASEVLRGLGYWFFYGRDKLGPWIEPAVSYTQQTWLILVSFAVPALAFAGAAVSRFRERAYFVALVLVGAVLAIGAYPYDDPSPLGHALKAAAEGSTAALAMRSTARAVPLVSLGLAVLLGGGLAAALRWVRDRRAGVAVGVLAAALLIANQPSLFTGDVVDPNLDRPEDVPAYWHEAAAALDSKPHDTRVLEIPGTDFAAYRWGNTVDPITPGLMDRPYVARELIPYGGDATSDLLNAFDRRLQEGVYEPAATAPVARLMSAGDVVVRGDLQFERYNTPRPKQLYEWMQMTPGLSAPSGFGPRQPTVGKVFPMQDERALAASSSVPTPPEVSVWPVDGVPPIVRAEPASRAVVVAGDGEGLVDAAAAGLVDGRGPVVYAASGLSAGVPSDSPLIVTDSNRRRGRRWSTVRENYGYTEQAGEAPLVKDPSDARLLDVFDRRITDADRTVAVLLGDVASVRASHYGNPVSFTPEDRPANALDGDPHTAWRVSAFDKAVGERLVVTLRHPVTTDHVTLTQPIDGPRNRWITRARLAFDGDAGTAVDVDLSDASRAIGGQRIDLPGGARTFSSVTVTVLADNFGSRASYIGLSGVGIAELAIDGVSMREAIRVPQVPLRDVDAARPLSIVLTRARTAPIPPRTDEELRLDRLVDLGAPRSFTLRGEARLDEGLPDERLDQLLGVGGVVARSSARLRGDIAARASAAIDGDPATAWMPGFGSQAGGWLEFDAVARPVTFDHLSLTVRADGRHSVPTRLRLIADGGAPVDVAVPAVPDTAEPDAVATVDVPVGRSLTARRSLRVELLGVRSVQTKDFFSEAPIEMPVAVAELGVPGLRVTHAAAFDATQCRSDLVTIDGTPLPVRLAGDTAAAARLQPFGLESCAPAVTLGAGRHEIVTATGRDVGIDVDRLVLQSRWATPPPVGAARVDVVASSRTSYRLRVTGATPGEPFWLVLGQSHNAGWHASGDLGPPKLVDGYANGWLVRPTSAAPMDVTLTWTPQRGVDIALVLSALGLLLGLALSVRRPFRRAAAVSVSSACSGTPNSPKAVGAPAVAVAAAAVVTGAVAAFVLDPVDGVVAAAGVVVALVWRRHGRLAVGLAGAALVGATGVYVAWAQHRYRYPPEFEWPTFFPRAHSLALAALALLGATAVAEIVQRRRLPTD